MLSVINKIEKQSNLIESIINNQLNLYFKYFYTLIFNLFNKYNLKNNPLSPPASSPFSCSNLKKIKVIEGDGGWVGSMCLLRDGRFVSGGNTIIKIYQQYIPHISIEEKYSVYSLCGLRNGDLASGGDDGDIRIYKIDENEYKHIHTLKGHKSTVLKIIELEDGTLCSSSEDKKIRISDKNYQFIDILIGHTHYVRSIIEINDYIISSSYDFDDDGVRIWSKHTYQCIKIIQNIYCKDRYSISKLKENRIILGGKNELFVLDILSFKSKSFRDQRLKVIHSILVLREDEILLGNNKGEIVCYDLLSNQIIFTQSLHNNIVNCIIKTEDNKILSCSDDGNINIYD